MAAAALAGAAAVCLAASAAAGAHARDLDARFSGDGIAAVGFPGYKLSLDEGERLAVLGAGAAPTLISSGQMSGSDAIGVAAKRDIVIARLTTRGARDRRFSRDGRQVIKIRGSDEIARAAAVQPDGKVVVAASSEGDLMVMRVTRKGKLDPTFSGDGLVTIDLGVRGEAGGVALARDGSVIVTGGANVTHSDGNDLDFVVAKLTAGGALDQSFSGDGLATIGFPPPAGVNRSDDVAHGVALTPEGKIVVAGGVRRFGDPPAAGEFFAAARLLPSGELDPAFGGGTVTAGVQSFDGAHAVALDSASRVVLAGAAAYDHFTALRYDTAGMLDASFGTDGGVFEDLGDRDFADALTVDPDGRPILAGTTRGEHDYSDFGVLRLTVAGVPDASFSGDGKALVDIPSRVPGGRDTFDRADSVAVDPAGRILLGGSSRPDVNERTKLVAVRLLSGHR